VPKADAEPVVIEWKGGSASAGYVGRRAWRYVSEHGTRSPADSDATARLLMEDVFRGIPLGREAELGSPLTIALPGRTLRLGVDERMVNGWAHTDGTVLGNGLAHADLESFLSELLASNAERAWARGVRPLRPPKLGDEFSFSAFAADPDPAARCERLAGVLDERLVDGAWPPVVLETAVDELRALGHDLSSIDPHRAWGRDYMTPRPGAGLFLHLLWDESDQMPEPHIGVEFAPPAD
jgi:hypothetical protein